MTIANGYGAQGHVARLRRVLVHAPGEEFNERNWSDYGYTTPLPNVATMRRQHAAFCAILEREGVSIERLGGVTAIQSAATTDIALVLEAGAIILNSGKPQRRAEMWPMARRLVELGIPIVGWLREHEFADGGDFMWLDRKTLVGGISYRTNEAGHDRIRRIVGELGVELVSVELPNWRGPHSVLHLMSAISPVSDGAVVVYPPVVPIRLMNLLAARQFRLIEVDAEEFETLGTNVLPLGGARALLCSGNPRTKAALERAGVTTIEFDGSELCFARGAGPTCHVLALHRA